MFHKILIGSDGSECACNAALLAAEIAKRFQSQTIIVSPLLASLLPPYRVIQELGHPVDALLTVAESEQADLIVVGSQGLTRLKEFFRGSVSSGVLHHAHCPVLVERGPVKPFERILLASDGSAGSQKAAAAAFALAKGFDACLSVLSVKEPSERFHVEDANPHAVKTPEELDERDKRWQAVEESVQASAKETAVPYRICEEQGHAGEAIVCYADNGRYDLIVMGSRGLGGFERLLLGSVSDHVLHHAHCSVLVVR